MSEQTEKMNAARAAKRLERAELALAELNKPAEAAPVKDPTAQPPQPFISYAIKRAPGGTWRYHKYEHWGHQIIEVKISNEYDKDSCINLICIELEGAEQ